MPKNPSWTRDELILALDLYFKAGRKQLDPNHRDVVQLSELLNRLPIHEPVVRNADFRNPQSVSMKLGNFLSVDPDYKGAGFKRGSKLDRQVWNEFAGDLAKLKLAAASIGSSTTRLAESRLKYDASVDIDEEFLEGRILTNLHKRKERNRKAIDQKKRKVLQETGRLVCEVCGFDFAQVYGQLGAGFAECHHIIPVSELTENHRTRLAELAIVCANCHRMIHKSRPKLSIAELSLVVQEHRG